MKKEPFWLGLLAVAAAAVYVGHYRSRPVEAPPPVIVLEPAPPVAEPEPVARVPGPPSCDCGAVRPPEAIVRTKVRPSR